MPYRLPVTVVSVFVLLLGLISAVAAQDQKGTLVVALDTLGAQTMDPILEGRAPHAHYQAPVFDSLAGFDYDKGGIGPGVAERWELAPMAVRGRSSCAQGSSGTMAIPSRPRCQVQPRAYDVPRIGRFPGRGAASQRRPH
jgi:hypothetical protein